tara:strand:- start:280 stop:483 length:204 start_codon:yes stop_codon:yes gene_type:complete
MIGPQTKKDTQKRKKQPFKKLTGAQNLQIRNLKGKQSATYIRRMRALMMKGDSFAQAQTYIRKNPKK